jgi:hypothetical protein
MRNSHANMAQNDDNAKDEKYHIHINYIKKDNQKIG